MSDSANDQEKLAALVEGKSDDDINAMATERGVDLLLGQVFAGMVSRFQPDRAAGQSAVVQWDIATPDGSRTFQLEVADGTCKVEPDGSATPRVTLGLSLPDFLRFTAGQLDGMQAFLTGRLKLSGDLMFAQTMAAWFGR